MSRHDPDHDAVCASSAARRVVVAPPGTGKTHLAARLAGSLIPHLPSPPVPDTTVGARVLLLTFSNQATAQLARAAAQQLSGGVRRRVVVSNYHSLFWTAVRAHRTALGLPPELEVVSAKRRLQALTAVDPTAVKRLNKLPGLLDAFAEQRFPVFRDDRTPDASLTARLLAAVEAEHKAGRLVFDDFGALFWQLLDHFPALEAAYRARYPIIVADEHQDASALQDAVIRRLNPATLVVLADPMQLIHGFRGARAERLDAHLQDCDAQFTLCTPHRWHDHQHAGEWLLAVRERLDGRAAPAARLGGAQITRRPAKYGTSGMLAPTKYAVSAAFNAGHKRVAVLTRNNADAGRIRSYLTREGCHPRARTGGTDFEDARAHLEDLATLSGPHDMAHHLATAVAEIVPDFPNGLAKQIEKRLKPDGVDLKRCSPDAEPILNALNVLYRDGTAVYFPVFVQVLDACEKAGHHVPPSDMVRAIRDTATTTTGCLDTDIVAASGRLRAAAQRPPREVDGLYVMTAHQSKGKEFDAVIIADATHRSYPEDLEGRNLFYVALTRGRSMWTIIATDTDHTPLLRHL
ncbi:superfamily I DNA/RNA helicase [Pseudonocardia kunmingensis]|uniref:Superfamily I DNA/RNA helicase n=1 Tax=Pseudonocardia kunmingensis TaxID=630975 RepID=A0A543DKQ8_9PSEU|nr:superfamily I DNA/RNA helicase [Pseudonocardia kunmingensis]